MQEAYGLLVIFNETEHPELLHRAIDSGSFSDTLGIPGWGSKTREICLLSIDGKTLTHAALGTRGKRVASLKYRVDFTEVIDLGKLEISDVLKRIPRKDAEELNLIIQTRGRYLPPNLWHAVVDAICYYRGHAASHFKKLEDLRLSSEDMLRSPEAMLLEEERDSIGLAMDIFDPGGALRKKKLGEIVIDPTQTAPFLAGLKTISRTEQQMLASDAYNFPSGILRSASAGAHFEINGRHLDILYLNQTKVERALGVDLIYYNRTFDAYTMVQYKRLTKTKREDAESGWVYRPNADAAFAKESTRMAAFAGAIGSEVNEYDWSSYRLELDAFYFKFCKSEGPAVLSAELIPGFYLPRLYLNALLKSRLTDGPNDGKVVSPVSMQRHLNNTTFADLVSAGWIGTRGLKTKIVEEHIHSSLKVGRDIIMAAGQRSPS